MTPDLDAIIRQRHVKVSVGNQDWCAECRMDWPCDAITLLDRLARLQEQVKGVACEVCWTTSWTPIEKVEDANGVNTKRYGKELTRCEYCWQEKVYGDKLAACEAKARELEGKQATNRVSLRYNESLADAVGKIQTLEAQLVQAERVVEWVRQRVHCLQGGSGNEPCRLNDQPDTWCIYHYLQEQAAADAGKEES